MLYKILATLAQEPQVPTPRDTPNLAPSPIIYIAIAIIVSGIIAWKYRLIIEFVAVVCSTVGGFMIGLIMTPPYANVGLGLIVSIAALLISTAAVTMLRLAQRVKQPALPS